MRKLERFLSAVNKAIDTPIRYAAVVCLGLSTLLSFFEVITRYGFDISHNWAQEISIFAVIYAAFLFGGPAFMRDEHIKIDFLSNRLSGLPHQLHVIVLDLATLFLCTFLFIYGTKLVAMNYSLGSRTDSQVFPIYPFYIAMPTGMFLLAFYSLVHLFKSILSLFSPEEEKVIENKVLD